MLKYKIKNCGISKPSVGIFIPSGALCRNAGVIPSLFIDRREGEARKQGFTLLELLAVIIILAALTTISIPIFANMGEGARKSAYETSKRELIKQAQAYLIQENISTLAYTNILENMKNKGYIMELPENPYKEAKNGLFSTSGSHAIVHNPNTLGYTEIDSLEDLNNVRNNLSGNYILMRDLDFDVDSSYENITNKTTWTTGEGWSPIGSGEAPFTGIFDGNGYSIRGLYINRPTKDYAGLFVKNDGTIRGLGIYSYSIVCRYGIGGFCGTNVGTIEDCYFYDNIYSNSSRVGGIVAENKGQVINCYVVCNIYAERGFVGGIAGITTGATSELENVYSIGKVSTHTTSLGGIAGEINHDSTLNKAYTVTELNLDIKYSYSHYYICGAVGNIYHSNNNFITNTIAMNQNLIGKNTAIGSLSTIRRISNYGASIPYENRYRNYAYKDMQISYDGGQTFSTKPISNDDHSTEGADITLEQFATQSWYEDNLPEWDFDTVWEFLPSATRPTLKNNPDGLGIDYPDGLKGEDRKNFKYYAGFDQNGVMKTWLVSRTGKDLSFTDADIIDRDGYFKSGIYYINEEGNIRKYSRYYNWEGKD